MFAEARVWARVCVCAAHSVTQAQSAHGVARPLNRILEEFLQRHSRFGLQKKKIIAGGRLECLKWCHMCIYSIRVNVWLDFCMPGILCLILFSTKVLNHLPPLLYISKHLCEYLHMYYSAFPSIINFRAASTVNVHSEVGTTSQSSMI